MDNIHDPVYIIMNWRKIRETKKCSVISGVLEPTLLDQVFLSDYSVNTRSDVNYSLRIVRRLSLCKQPLLRVKLAARRTFGGLITR